MAFLHGIETLEITDGIRSVATVATAIIGIIGTAPDADVLKFPLNTPVLITGPRAGADLDKSAEQDNLGTLKDGLDGIFDQTSAAVVVVRVAEGVDDDATLANVVGSSATGTGVHAFKDAESIVKITPKILVSPGWTHQRPLAAANPVVAELEGVATSLRAVIIADGPSTNDADAIEYRDDWDSDRIYVVDPQVLVSVGGLPVAQPASARVAGKLAYIDKTRGFWWSPSNQTLNGIVGVARSIPFSISDTSSPAQLLNASEVAAVIHHTGYRLWGNRTTSSDPQLAFLNVRRVKDAIAESLENAHLWAMDRPFSAQLLEDITGTVNAYLRELKAKGAIIGGVAWLDLELNTPTAFQAGQLYVDYDIEPAAPLERLTFRQSRNAGYYEEILIAA